LDLAATGLTGEAAAGVSRDFPPHPEYGAALVIDTSSQIEIVAVAAAAEILAQIAAAGSHLIARLTSQAFRRSI
jgi:hypothetical protein